MLKIWKNQAYQKHPENLESEIEDFKATVSIAFYNRLDVLKLTLAGLERQSEQNFEVLILDDGSKEDVVKEFKEYADTLPLKIKHLWHEDLGFRKNRMLNWCLHHGMSDYHIFLDQDCIPHKEFVREHTLNQETKTVLCGRRMEFTGFVSKMLTPERVRNGFIEWNLWWIIPAISYMKDNNGPKGIYLRSKALRKLATARPRGILGCNFSTWKQDLIAVNGFDIRYEKPTIGEDTDIEFRLRKNGIQMKSVANLAVQYHVWHKLTYTPDENRQLYAEVERLGLAKTQHGLQQMLEQAKTEASN